MENFNVLNKVITIENYNGDSVMTIEIDEKGEEGNIFFFGFVLSINFNFLISGKLRIFPSIL